MCSLALIRKIASGDRKRQQAAIAYNPPSESHFFVFAAFYRRTDSSEHRKLGGSEPSGYGSSSGEGEECAEEERQEKRLDWRVELAGEAFGEGLEKFEGGRLSLHNLGGSFAERAGIFQTILYTKRQLPVKTNDEKFLEGADNNQH